ncbi:MAG: serine/threonine protein kinase [Planctomycetaceae bacterium]|nr:serine/threonine protein kinase [Planctomycetaceae bacterium]
MAVCLIASAQAHAENWPSWRGPRGDGSSTEKNVPTKWNGSTGDNIHWKAAIPGIGHSSPIIWKDHVFVASCLTKSQERVLVCLDRSSGEQIWSKTVLKARLEKKHSLNSFASSTPATDGKTVFISFLEVGDKEIPAPNVGSKRLIFPGEMVVAAYDFNGDLKWKKNPGQFISAHGYCSNPILYKNLVIVNGDHDGDSYIVALDKNTGDEIWRVNRRFKTRSYVTPLIRKINGVDQLVFSGSKCIISLNPADGSKIWTIDGATEQFVASMVYDGDLFFMAAGFPTYHVMGIRPTGKGNVTDSHVAWHAKNAKCYVPSPVVLDGYLMVADDRGTANCFDAKTGERYWQGRLGRHFSTSLITANGLVYFVADDGLTKLVRPGKEREIVAENPLGEFTYSSPAISDGQLFIRGEDNLYCIGAK